MLFQANRFCTSVREYLTGLVKEYVVNFQLHEADKPFGKKDNEEIPLEEMLSGDTDQFLISLLSACDIISDWAAPISTYLLENHPECKSFVIRDNSRFSEFNWIEFMVRFKTKDERHAYGFVENEDGAITWVEDEGIFDIWDIKLTEDEFYQAVMMIPARTQEVNFAIKSACTLINYMSWGLAHFEARKVADTSGYKDEDRECFLQETEGAWYQPAEPDGPHFLCRKIQIVYQDKTFKTYEGSIKAADCPKNLAPGLIGEWFVKENCPKLSRQARLGLSQLAKSKVSYRFKGRQLKQWLERAELYKEYMSSKLTVLKWFYSRVEVVDARLFSKPLLFCRPITRSSCSAMNKRLHYLSIKDWFGMHLKKG